MIRLLSIDWLLLPWLLSAVSILVACGEKNRADETPSSEQVALGSFSITAPAETERSAYPVVTFTAAANAISYHVIVAVDAACTEIHEETVIGETSYKLTKLTREGDYYVCVSAAGGDGATINASNSPLLFHNESWGPSITDVFPPFPIGMDIHPRIRICFLTKVKVAQNAYFYMQPDNPKKKSVEAVVSGFDSDGIAVCLEFTSKTALEYGSEYTLKGAIGSFTDLEGNPWHQESIQSFTTAANE